MKKSYHEHCREEREEALKALSRAEKESEGNVPIVYLNTFQRKITLTVPPHRLGKIIAKLKKRGGRIIQVNGEPFNAD